MPDGVVMDVIDMTLVIRVIPYRMFPKPPLPDASFTFVQAALGAAFGVGQLTRKGRFDLSPTGRKIVIAFRQRPNTMKMIGQYHDGLHLKGMCLLDLAESGP
jgi:hypothetical protein